MGNSKISIIVPVYKAEVTLHKCVDSILAQTYSNLEIILVDDGSPDSSGTLCDELTKIDKRIVVVHKDNGGVSSARNAGLKKAGGEFVGFVDSDDTIEPNMYELLLKAIEDNNSEMAVCGYFDIYSFGSKRIEAERITYAVEDYLNAAINNFRLYRTMRGPWNRLIRSSVINLQNNALERLYFSEQLSYGEDTAFVSDALIRCKYVTFIDSCLYNHMIYDNSSSLCADTESDRNINDAMISNNHLCANFIKILPESQSKISEVIELQNLLAKRDGKATAALRNICIVNNAYRLSFKEMLRILKLSNSSITTVNTLLVFFAPMKLYRAINHFVLKVAQYRQMRKGKQV